ncbi:hypothetical protein [Neorhodopirellula pilleata]|uniref:Uncharacterized protein n=1 Tax=Neorhodopirellula pilleata TaxID=2714738 RepID=A0A5C6A017_9BACT|nr:hypothetical protein [Neorhodopirellula pilleata]TWT93162.1 hypothetical protein Pla100_44790 [Neorhodopirellula pilleata]
MKHHPPRMNRLSSLIGISVWLLVGGLCWIVTSASAAQSGTDAPAEDPLVARQSSVAQRYARLEELLLRLADVESRENPERAALLKRVAKQSREKFVLEKLQGAGTLIAKGQLSQALEDQKTATTDLQSLLKLLLSEDRSSRIRDEKKRIAEIIKQLRLTERNERSVRARTENGVDLDEVAKEQAEIAKRAEQLSDELNAQDETSEKSEQDEKSESTDPNADPSAESKPGESKPAESKPDEMKPGENKPSESESGEPKPSESKPSESKPSESKPGESKPSEPQQGEQQQAEQKQGEQQQGEQQQNKPQQPPQSPEQLAEQQLKKAIESMKQAQEKLAQEQRSEATEEQRQAEEELRKAIDKLEKILRQLREEEIERELAKLEARLRKMAAMQSAILDETIQLAKTPAPQRNRATDLKAGDLSFEEQKITLEADRAMLLLKEEGSSVAFPEVILQLREDTRRVATRLGQSKIDAVTQGIQNDILAALEEMIDALAKAQRDLEKKKQQEQQQQQGQPSGQGSQEEPLVESLAELKLIRTMQTRIQSTTDRYGELLQDDNAGDLDNSKVPENVGEDILPLLRDLAQRQDRLYQITRDLVTKRNR